jgi:hypothetical protein
MLQQPTAVLEFVAYFYCWCSLEVVHMWLQHDKIYKQSHVPPTYIIQHMGVGDCPTDKVIYSNT